MSATNIHEEEALGKAYDSRLMSRLLSYVRPFWKAIAVAITLVLVITAADLSRPYLIKVAIDEHMQPIEKLTFVSYPASSAPDNGVNVGDYTFVREQKSLEPRLPRWHVVETNGQYQMQEIAADQVTNSSQSIKLTQADIDSIKTKDKKSLFQIGAIYFAIIIIGFGLNYAQTMILQWTGQRIIFNIRQQLFSHLQRLSLSFFDRNPVGRLVTRVMNDTETLNEMYTNMLVNLFKDIFILIGIVIVMLQLNTRLALIAFISVPFIVLSTLIYRRVARNAFRDVRVKIARINATLAENIAGMRIVQIFKREKKVYAEFEGINRDHYRASMRELRTFAVFRPSMDFIYTMTLALLIWYGGGRVMFNGLEFGVLYAFISYIQQFFQPINDLSEKYNILQSAMASSERIFQLLDTRSAIENPVEPKNLSQLTGGVQFENVWFAYQEEEWVLKDVSFDIKPGQTVAFVGATGAGKSSILNLITRFYDIQKGRILIDGRDVKEVALQDLRRQIAVVQQDVFLFTGTVRDNIRLHEPTISDEQIEAAIHHVNADSFINKLPNGLDEQVQERGITFSAGQRQLLAFARALAFDPAILVLDEATANIDTETESLIQDALEKLTQNRTTIIVAHRLSTIQHADQIIVMHKGRIREAGSHQELLAKKGMYYNLYQLQYKEQLDQIDHEVTSA